MARPGGRKEALRSEFLDVLASVPSLRLFERKRRREYLEKHTLANQLRLGWYRLPFLDPHFTSVRAPGLPSSRSARPLGEERPG
jgi:hypothetical protein